MKKFSITIERQVSKTHDFEIEAEDADEARELAEDETPNIDPADWELGLAEESEVKKVVELSDAVELEDADESEEASDEVASAPAD